MNRSVPPTPVRQVGIIFKNQIYFSKNKILETFKNICKTLQTGLNRPRLASGPAATNDAAFLRAHRRGQMEHRLDDVNARWRNLKEPQ